MDYVSRYEMEQKMRAEQEKKNDKEFARRVIVLIVLGILLIAAVATLITYRAVVTNYEFQREVHSYMENAYWASTPELMITQLELCMGGMRGLGLSEDMYAKYLPWEQTPDWRMDYCYAHLEAIIVRCYEVISWRDAQDLNSGQVTDVYNQKMSALHDFLRDGGWSDEIARGAYYVNYHPMLCFWYPVVLALAFIGWVVLALYYTFKRYPGDGEDD